MIISFAWTTPAVCYGEKCETRRDWSAKQVALARKVMEAGDPVDAWTKSPRFGGEPFGQIQILEITDQEDASTIPDLAWADEGFHVLTAINATFAKNRSAPDVWRFWRQSAAGTNLQTVVRFEVLRLNDVGEQIRAETGRQLSASFGPTSLADMRETVGKWPEWSGI